MNRAAKLVGLIGGVVPGVGPAIGPVLESLARRRERHVPTPPEVRRELYRQAAYRVVAWIERPYAADRPCIYVGVERDGQQVRLWSDITLTPAPWWAPWRRKRELGAVIEQAIAFVEQQDSLEMTAAATLEAFTEVTRST